MKTTDALVLACVAGCLACAALNASRALGWGPYVLVKGAVQLGVLAAAAAAVFPKGVRR